MPTFEDSLAGVHAAIALLPADESELTGLTDDQLTSLPAGLAAARHQLEAREARVAGRSPDAPATSWGMPVWRRRPGSAPPRNWSNI